jgi:hypothetical protein
VQPVELHEDDGVVVPGTGELRALLEHALERRRGGVELALGLEHSCEHDARLDKRRPALERRLQVQGGTVERAAREQQAAEVVVSVRIPGVDPERRLVARRGCLELPLGFEADAQVEVRPGVARRRPDRLAVGCASLRQPAGLLGAVAFQDQALGRLLGVLGGGQGW